MSAETFSREMVEQRLRSHMECFHIHDSDKTMMENILEVYHSLRESHNHTCNRFHMNHLIVNDDMEKYKKELALSAQIHANGVLDEMRLTIQAQAKKLQEMSILTTQQAFTIEGLAGVVKGCEEWYQIVREWIEKVQLREDENLRRVDGVAAAVYDLRDTLETLDARLKKVERSRGLPIPEVIEYVEVEPPKKKRRVRS